MNTSGMGYKILDERYALLECLAVSSVGEVYRGRDLELTQDENASSRILIHLLPSHCTLTDLAAAAQQAQSLAANINKEWLLPILSQGQSNGRSYFVLASPAALGAQSVLSLPSNLLPTSAQLQQQFASLVKAKRLPATIDSALLLILPNQSLQLLSTALIPNINALRTPSNGLAIYQRSKLKPALALTGIMTIALSTFAVEYQSKPAIQPPPVPATHLSSPQALFAQAGLSPKLHYKTEALTDLAMPVALRAMLPATSPNLLGLAIPLVDAAELAPGMKSPVVEPKAQMTSEREPAKALEIVESSKPQEPSKTKATNKAENKDKAKNTVEVAAVKLMPVPATKVAAAPSQVEVKPLAVNTVPATETVYRTASVEAVPVVTYKQPAASKSQPLAFDELVERANRALESQNFSAKNGVLFYTRQIKIRDHLHPQVERLGRSVVMYQHEIARNMLKFDEPVQAHALLNSSKNLIQEFNLKSLNSAQEVLEHKSTQYNK